MKPAPPVTSTRRGANSRGGFTSSPFLMFGANSTVAVNADKLIQYAGKPPAADLPRVFIPKRTHAHATRTRQRHPRPVDGRRAEGQLRPSWHADGHGRHRRSPL